MILKKCLKVFALNQYSEINLQNNEVLLPFTIATLRWFGFDFGNIRFKTILFILLIEMFSIFGEVLSMYHQWGTMLMFNGVSSTIFGVRCVIHILDLLFNKDNFKYVCKAFSDKIWVRFDKKERSKCEKKLRLPRWVCYATIASAFAYMIEPTIQVLSLGSDYASKAYIVSVHYPIETRRPVVHEITYLLINIGGFVRASLIANVNLIMNYFIVYTSYRFDEISKTLTDEVFLNNGVNTEQYREKIRKAIEQQQILISATNKLQEMFSLSIFVQFLTDSLMICVLGAFVLLAEPSIVVYFKVLLFLLAVSVQEYVNCVAGESIIHSSADVGNAVYMSNWQDYDPTDPSIGLIIQRSQKVLKLTGLGFFDLSLTTFTTVCNRSMSYFTILRTFFE